jgi:hypothetical protein
MTKLDLCNLSTSQRCAIRCAFADLIGAYQAHQQNDMHVHDWDAHRQSILDLAECFGFNEDLVEAHI